MRDLRQRTATRSGRQPDDAASGAPSRSREWLIAAPTYRCPRAAAEADDDRISRALNRLESACAITAGVRARRTTRPSTTLTDGLRCRTDELGGTIETDLPVALGGDGAAPTPERAPASRTRQLPGDGLPAARGPSRRRLLLPIRVVVETDSAIAGMLDRDAVEPAGFMQIRYLVEIASDAPREQVGAIVDEADRLSPVLDVVSGANRPIRSLTITDGAG